jgi:8-oxo-dGTP pyrophosphatase MutT (NUDIX family)
MAQTAGVELPDYCCAILRVADGRFVCERRPLTADRAPGRLTCFGGHREAGEDALGCLLREVQEETGWRPAPEACRRAVTLRVGSDLVAWFYIVDEEPPLAELRAEPGFAIELVDLAGIAAPAFSDWHRAVLLAWLRGETEVAL